MEAEISHKKGVESIVLRTKAVASALRVSDTAISQYVNQIEEKYGIQVTRQEEGPAVKLFSVRDMYAMASLRRENRLYRPLQRPIAIAVYAQKGGVGKSTVASNIISMIQLEGHNVLGIDADHQGNLTSMFGYDHELTAADIAAQGLSEERLIQYHFGNLFQIPPFYDIQSETSQSLSKVIKQPFSSFGPDIVPADTTLSVLESAIGIASNRDYLVEFLLRYARMPEGTQEEIDNKRRFTQHDMRKYDFVVFDCPPQAAHNTLIRPILLACDLLVVPVRMDELSIKGLSLMYSALRQMLQDFGKAPDVLLLPTFYNERLRRVQLTQAQLIQQYGQDLSSVKIPTSEEIPSSLSESVPLAISKPTSKLITGDFRQLVDEILERSYTIASRKA